MISLPVQVGAIQLVDWVQNAINSLNEHLNRCVVDPDSPPNVASSVDARGGGQFDRAHLDRLRHENGVTANGPGHDPAHALPVQLASAAGTPPESAVPSRLEPATASRPHARE